MPCHRELVGFRGLFQEVGAHNSTDVLLLVVVDGLRTSKTVQLSRTWVLGFAAKR